MDLFSWVPPQIMGDRHGETYDRARDRVRLDGQSGDVFRFMQDGDWHLLSEIAITTGHPEASVPGTHLFCNHGTDENAPYCPYHAEMNRARAEPKQAPTHRRYIPTSLLRAVA